mmetsp:Transcript_0/g.2  ORF Transcript_0/g.2 Transcript_0/m.2 type:complete len:234 (+) Transcript_0:268-969(+)
MAGSWWRSTLWKKSSRAGGGATTRPFASSSSRSSTRRRARPRGTVTMRWPHMALAPPRRPHMKAAALVSAVKPASAQSASAGRYALAARGAGASGRSFLRSSPWNSRGIAGSALRSSPSGSSKRLNSFFAPSDFVGVSLWGGDFPRVSCFIFFSRGEAGRDLGAQGSRSHTLEDNAYPRSRAPARPCSRAGEVWFRRGAQRAAPLRCAGGSEAPSQKLIATDRRGGTAGMMLE